MKTKVLAFIVLMMFCAGAVTALATESNWLGAQPGADTIKTFWQFILRLEVKDSQKTQIKALFTEQQQQAQKIRNDSSLSTENKQSRMEALNSATHKKVLDKLTSDQREQLQSMSGFQP